MRIHCLLPLPVIIVSFGIETETERTKTGYDLLIITTHPISPADETAKSYLWGSIEYERYKTDWLDGVVVTLAPWQPFGKFLHWCFHR